MDEKETPMIPKYYAENTFMHLSHANRRMLIALITVCVTFILTIIIFVHGYTVREKNWLDTLSNLRTTPVTEVQQGGTSIAPRKNGIMISVYDTTIPAKATGTTSRQGGDAYNGTLYILCNDNKMCIVNLQSMAKIADADITCEHGNSCQFGKTIASGESIPRLFCFGYKSNKVYENSISNNVATLQKTYVLPITGYRLSGGYDAIKNRFITIHYTLDSSTDPAGNGCVLSVWDLNTLTDNGDNTYSPRLAIQNNIPFIGTIQDCKVYGGLLYVLSGSTVNTDYPATYIHAFNETGLVNSVVVYPVNGNEPEELFFVEKGDDVFTYIGDSRFHVLKFL